MTLDVRPEPLKLLALCTLRNQAGEREYFRAKLDLSSQEAYKNSILKEAKNCEFYEPDCYITVLQYEIQDNNGRPQSGAVCARMVYKRGFFDERT